MYLPLLNIVMRNTTNLLFYIFPIQTKIHIGQGKEYSFIQRVVFLRILA